MNVTSMPSQWCNRTILQCTSVVAAGTRIRNQPQGSMIDSDAAQVFVILRVHSVQYTNQCLVHTSLIVCIGLHLHFESPRPVQVSTAPSQAVVFQNHADDVYDRKTWLARYRRWLLRCRIGQIEVTARKGGARRGFFARVIEPHFLPSLYAFEAAVVATIDIRYASHMGHLMSRSEIRLPMNVMMCIASFLPTGRVGQHVCSVSGFYFDGRKALAKLMAKRRDRERYLQTNLHMYFVLTEIRTSRFGRRFL